MLLFVKNKEILPLLLLEVKEHAPFEPMMYEAEGTWRVVSKEMCELVKSSSMNKHAFYYFCTSPIFPTEPLF